MPRTAPAASLAFEPVLDIARRRADRDALADIHGTLTYGALATAIESGATLLRARGIAPGDRVLVVGANATRQVAAHFAALRAGAVSVPLAGQITAERLAFVASDCEARLICTDGMGEVATSAVAASLGIEVVGETDLRQAMAGGELLAVAADRAPDDLACLMYTTGSTGQPKAVMLSHRSLGSALDHIVDYLEYDGEDREAVVLPLSHSFGLGHVYCVLRTGGFAWLHEGLRPLKALLDALTTQRIHTMPTTPSMLRLLLGPYRAAFIRAASGLRRMVVNSEPLPPQQARDLLEALPSLDVVVYYGLTEASRSTFLRLRDEPAERYALAGKAPPGVTIEIHDEVGNAKAAGVEGEVCIRGPHLAVGYWQRPEEQAAAFRDGWLRTGDLGTIDAAGYVRITGRLKDQINVGGLKVSAAEIEGVLRAHPLVLDAAASGVTDPRGMTGEIVAAAIVLREGTLDESDIARFCADRLEPQAIPSIVRTVPAIPRADSGKILRGEVRRMLEGGDAGAGA